MKKLKKIFARFFILLSLLVVTICAANANGDGILVGHPCRVENDQCIEGAYCHKFDWMTQGICIWEGTQIN